MKSINKDIVKKLTKVIYSMKAQDIPLNDLLYGIKGLTLLSVYDAMLKNNIIRVK